MKLVLDQLIDLAATVHYLVVDGPAGLSESTSAILTLFCHFRQKIIRNA